MRASVVESSFVIAVAIAILVMLLAP